MNVGEKIVEFRTARQMSQQTLADLLFVSRDLVSKWENGTRTPDYPTVERIAGILQIKPETILDKNDLILKELSECTADIRDVPQNEMTEIMNAFLKNLDERTAGVFLMRYYCLKTTSEIASKYRIGENHVRSLLSKTRKKLRKYIGGI